MKTIVCGPAHSGKSVFIANLIYKLPSDSSTTIRACPDGEGTWSNNQNQNEVLIVRKKGKFNKEFIEESCKAIDNQKNDIVLVDVGGQMTKENRKIFKHCDSFIVLSSDEKLKQKWLRYGKYLGLECIACIDSSLEGQEEIYSRKPYLQGKIVGLERGKKLEDSQVINTVVSEIVEKSKQEKAKSTEEQNFNGVTIENMELASEIGNITETLTEQGNIIKHTEWSQKHIPQVYKLIKEKIKPKDDVRIEGIRPNFLISAICKACKKQGAKQISAFDIRSNKYIPIRQLPKRRGIKTKNGLSFNIIQNKENVFLDIDLLQDNYSLEDYSKCILPKINERKNLYLSGRLPNWLIASITNSYNSSKIYTFQPGKGFSCVSSIDEKDLGTVVNGITRININQYYEDKKQSRESKLPIVPQKKGLFSKIKQVLHNENNKYLDNSIISQKVTNMPKQNTLRKQLQENVEQNQFTQEKSDKQTQKRRKNDDEQSLN